MNGTSASPPAARPTLRHLAWRLVACCLLAGAAMGADSTAATVLEVPGDQPAATAPAALIPAPAGDIATAVATVGLATTAADATAATLTAVVPADVLADYRRWLDGRDPLAITDFRGPGARRDVVEVALMQQALRAGGCTDRVDFVESPSYARELVEIAEGRAAVTSTSAWGFDIQPADSGMVASPAIIDSGEFLAGLYTTATNAVAMHAQDRADLARLRFVSCHDWSADWRALTTLAPAELDDVATWAAMPRLVAAGRADVLLAPFQSTPDLSLVVDGITLVPIPNLAVAISGSRHFATARTPAGARALAALAIGVPKLRSDGVVLRAYQQSGFFNPQISGWKKIIL